MSNWQKEKEEAAQKLLPLFYKKLAVNAGIPAAVIVVSVIIIAVSGMLLTLPTVAAVVALCFLAKALIPLLQVKDKHLPQDLQRLLTTPEETAQFDAEMAMGPVAEIQLLKNDGRLYFTEHYLVRETGGLLPKCRVLLKDEIRSCQVFTNPRSTIVRQATQPHIIEFYSQDRKTIAVIEIGGRAACTEFELAYNEQIPDAHWNLGKYILK